LAIEEEAPGVASDPEFVKFVCEQLGGAGNISSRRMFGEAAVYLEGKVIGLVCDNQFFLKATEPGRTKIGAPTEAAPFPGANPWFLLADLDDPEFLADLARVTAAALPGPKAKKQAPTKSAARPARRAPAKPQRRIKKKSPRR
jgi:TfoX/Sxy family transcriptional regulator of competence genes